MTLKSVNIDKDASFEGLYEKLLELSVRRGIKVSRIAAKIYIHAVNNPGDYKSPLKDAPKHPGKHISARVTDAVSKDLLKLAKDKGSTRNKWCALILMKALESGNIEKIIDAD